jgi:cytoskeletal protein CcmA (bactofilin family)
MTSQEKEPTVAEHDTTLIAADTDVKGEMSFDHNCRILGKFEGTITAEGDLHVAEGASCKAQVEAQTVTVDGKVEGNITAKDKVTLNATASVSGDIVAAKLIVAEGAVVSGHLSIGAPANSEAGGPRPKRDNGTRQGGGSTPTSAGHGAPRSPHGDRLSNAPKE